MTVGYIIYALIGRLLTYLLQKFLSSNIENGFFGRLIECDLCLGWWIYTGLSLAFRINILYDIFPYVPFLSAIITGSITTFIMHLLILGWRLKFEVVEI